jgi:threonylcarbamoyladenosine tRNA methylthiotransferase MtaB
MKKAYITTLGCKVNQFESASIKNSFEDQGYTSVEFMDDADIIVINTCAVTAKASGQSRQLIRKAARLNKNAAIVVTGCHAQLAAEEIKKMSEISCHRLCIIGNDQKDILVPHILETDGRQDVITDDLQSNAKEICLLPVSQFARRSRAYLRIQDGCNSFCSYCIVPYTRGKSRSLPKNEVVKQARQYMAAGHREIVVTGIHVGQYGRDLSESCDISSLMELLCTTMVDVRFRLSSIEPLEISPVLLTLMSEMDNFMPHLHIPLQSGDNDILKRMNRRYTREQFLSILQACRARLPDAAIGIDVLAGFPGESNEHFRNTRSFLEDIDFTYLHVFPYSKRPGTKAASFPDQVKKQEKSERVAILRNLSEKNRIAFYTDNIGTRRSVLIENERDGSDLLKGFTDNYVPVLVDGADNLKNSIVAVELGELMDGRVKANLIHES